MYSIMMNICFRARNFSQYCLDTFEKSLIELGDDSRKNHSHRKSLFILIFYIR
jgi:hypothetical protein